MECCTNDGPAAGSREILAVSVVNLQRVFAPAEDYFSWLNEREPIAKIGDSIYLYDITGDAQAHLHMAEAYIKSKYLLPQAESEIARVLSLDPSNAEAKLMASTLHPPGLERTPAS